MGDSDGSIEASAQASPSSEAKLKQGMWSQTISMNSLPKQTETLED